MKSSKRLNTLFIAFLGIGLLATSCKKEGCTDPIATNYNDKANEDDGTCIYGPADGPGITTEITEDVIVPTTWLAGNYTVCGNIRIESSLVIEPGVNLIMCAGSALIVRESGSMDATGTAANPIVIRGEEATAGYWSGISIESNNPNNKFNYVSVSDAGSYWAYEDANVHLATLARLSVQNSTFSNSEGYGLQANPSATFSAFSNNTFSDNTFAGLYIHVDQLKSLDDASSYNVSNGENHVLVDGGTISAAATWSMTVSPVLIDGYLTIDNALTIEPGVDIMMESSSGIDVNESGSLNAEGSVSEPITIRGKFSTPAYWEGINIGSNNPNNVFEYVNISDGGAYWAYEYSGIIIDGRLDLDNCTVSNSNSYAVFVKSSSTLYCSGAVQTDVPGVTAVNTLTGNGVGPDADCVDGCMVFWD